MAPSNKQTIVVVEDSPDSREMLKFLLESLDYRVLEAQTGTEALELAVNHQPDLILTDFGLPDTDGIELIKQLRLLGTRYGEVPIIMLTASDREQFYSSAMAAGCTAFFSKPIDSERLGSVINRLIHKK